MCAKIVGSGLQAQQRGQALMCNCFSDAMSAAIPLAQESHVTKSSIHVGKDYPRTSIQRGTMVTMLQKIWKKKYAFKNTQNIVVAMDDKDLLG